jgi:tetratricopeptide (TPR) repeat protein
VLAWEHGDFEGSAKHLRKAIAVNPPVGRKKALFLADALMNLGKAPEAVTVLEELARESPLLPFGLSLLGHAYLESRKYADAASHFEKVLAADPESAGGHFALARCYDKLGDPQKARKHRDEYARRKKLQLADIARVRVELRKSELVEFYPFLWNCHVNVGKMYALHGKFDAAEKHWLRAVALDPRNPEPRALLAALYRQQGRPIDAARVSGQSGVESSSAHAP